MAKKLTARQQRREDRIAAKKAAAAAPPPVAEQNIAAQDQLSATALDLAGKNLGGTQLGTAFQPQLSERTSGADLAADRQRIEEETFARLSRDMDQRYAQEKEMTAQRLANQGIAYSADPNSRYQQELMGVDKRFDLARTDARQRAAEIGGQEYSRDFGISEQLRANQFSEQQGIRNQQLGEFGTLTGQGNQSVQNWALSQGIKNQEDQLALQKYIAQLQAKTQKQIAGGIGGGGGGSSEPAPPSESAAGF